MTEEQIAAHRVADALRVIAENLPKLTAQASDPLYDLFYRANVHYPKVLQDAANKVAATAPFAPLDEAETQTMWEQVYDEMGDLSQKDHARAYMDQPEWALRHEWSERVAMMEEDEDEEGDDA